MRDLKAVAGAVVCLVAMSGCALRDREWGTCAVAGGIIGATVGGITGGVTVNNSQNHPSNEARGGAIGGGIVGGGALGALLGHAICDPEKKPPAPPPPAPPPPPPPPPHGTKIATLRGPEFDFNKSVLRPDGKKLVDAAVQTLKDNPTVKVLVEGHTDSIGSDAYNQKLSERRAQTVRDYMVEKGIAASRITTKGRGKTQPVASNKTAEGRAQNRRVEIIVD